MKEKHFKIITIILSITFILIFLEIFLRILRPERLEVSAYEDIYTDVYSQSKKANVKALKPNMERKRWGTIVKINSYGERDYEYSIKKKDNNYRVAVIGDSVAFGFGISLEDSFPKVLEKKLNKISDRKVEVLLFGRPGFAVSDVYYIYLDKVKMFNPDLIIYAMVLNDFEDKFLSNNSKSNKTEENKITLKKVLKKLNRSVFYYLRRFSAVYNLIIDSIFKILVSLGFIDINEGRALDCFYPDSLKFKNKLNVTEKWLNLLDNTFTNDKKDFLICLFPYQFQLDNKILSYYLSKGFDIPVKDILKIQDILKNFCMKNNINFIDFVSEYSRKNSADLYIKNDYGHPNEKGHLISAEVIFDYINKKQFINR